MSEAGTRTRTVHVLVHGLTSWLKRGPRWASVRTITVTDLRAGCLEDRRFEITG